MNTLIFDLETTGLPLKNGKTYFKYDNLEKYNNSRVLSICWKIFNNNNKEIKSNYKIIKPTDFIIDNNSYACKINNITKELADEKGIDIKLMFNELKQDLIDTNVIVAHNLDFDYNILLSELYRYNRLDIINLLQTKDKYCTMMNGIQITKIPMKNSYKFPKLIELYRHFFNTDFEDAHNAEADVSACSKCYFKMVN